MGKGSHIIKGKQDAVQDTERNTTLSCWRFPPLQDMSGPFNANREERLDTTDLTAELELATKECRSYGQLVHATSRCRPQTYIKWIIMKHAEILMGNCYIFFKVN